MPDNISIEEVMNDIKGNSVSFVNLQFSDIMGVAKSVTIPAHKFSDACQDGLWFDGSSVEGFTRIYESDMLLKPDLRTYAIIPWLSQNGKKIARVICDVYTPDGEPYESDPRGILIRVLEKAKKMGLIYKTGPEMEFFLFDSDDGEFYDSSGRKIQPHDHGQYFDLVMDRGFDIRRHMMNAIEEMGIEVESSHHEVAPGQQEIAFKYGDALETADKVMTMKYALKSIAHQHGLYVTFMPKPISGINGNGMHVHQSLFSPDGENLFYNPNDKYKLSDIAYHFLAGQMKHARANCAILNPIVNSYKRLVPGYEASTYICWAQINRSALIRVPRYTKGKEKSVRLEIRNPDPSSNPYLAFAVLLAAGLDGIENKLDVMDAVEEDVFGFNNRKLEEMHIDLLPHSLSEAIDILGRDEEISSALGPDFMEKYVRAKTKEWDDYRVHVTDWEIKKYLGKI